MEIEKLRQWFRPFPLEEAKVVLFVQPHPDDVDLALGATVSKLSSEGKKVYYLTVTDGRKGTFDPNTDEGELARTRKREEEKAAEILGVHELLWLDFEDLGDYSVEEARREVVRVLRNVNPDVVITVDPFLPYESHPDHRKTGLAVTEAVAFAGLPTFDRESFKPTEIKSVGYFFTAYPNTFVNVDGHFEKKLLAIEQHKSQFDPEYLRLVQEYLTERARTFGRKIGCLYAEELKLLSVNALHIVPEAVFL